MGWRARFERAYHRRSRRGCSGRNWMTHLVTFGLREIFPFVFVEEISFPFRVRLSTSTEVRPLRSVMLVPSATASVPIVIESFTSSAFATPPSLIVTTPEATAKLLFENEAMPFVVVVASSIATSPDVTVKYEPPNEAIPLFEAVASSPLTVAVPEE